MADEAHAFQLEVTRDDQGRWNTHLIGAVEGVEIAIHHVTAGQSSARQAMRAALTELLLALGDEPASDLVKKTLFDELDVATETVRIMQGKRTQHQSQPPGLRDRSKPAEPKDHQ